jgi:hypothetical protein
MIRGSVDGHDKSVPAILEIPSKEHPYDASKDSILRRARVSPGKKEPIKIRIDSFFLFFRECSVSTISNKTKNIFQLFRIYSMLYSILFTSLEQPMNFIFFFP